MKDNTQGCRMLGATEACEGYRELREALEIIAGRKPCIDNNQGRG